MCNINNNSPTYIHDAIGALFNTEALRGVLGFFNRTGCTLIQNALKPSPFLPRHDLLHIEKSTAGWQKNSGSWQRSH